MSDLSEPQEEAVLSSIASAASLQRKSLLRSTSQVINPVLNPRSMTARILLEKEKEAQPMAYLDAISSLQQSTSSVDRAKEQSSAEKARQFYARGPYGSVTTRREGISVQTNPVLHPYRPIRPKKGSKTARISAGTDNEQSTTVFDHATLEHTGAAINETSVDASAPNFLHEPITPGSSVVQVTPSL